MPMQLFSGRAASGEAECSALGRWKTKFRPAAHRPRAAAGIGNVEMSAGLAEFLKLNTELNWRTKIDDPSKRLEPAAVNIN